MPTMLFYFTVWNNQFHKCFHNAEKGNQYSSWQNTQELLPSVFTTPTDTCRYQMVKDLFENRVSCPRNIGAFAIFYNALCSILGTIYPISIYCMKFISFACFTLVQCFNRISNVQVFCSHLLLTTLDNDFLKISKTHIRSCKMLQLIIQKIRRYKVCGFLFVYDNVFFIIDL